MEILITGGLGDFFAVESVMTDSEKSSVKKIHLATPGAKFILQAIKYHSCFSCVDVVSHFTPEEIARHTTSGYCIHSIAEMNQTLKRLGRDELARDVQDFSILRVFPEIRKGKRRYHSHGFGFPRTSCDLVVDTASHSGDFRISERAFTDEEIGLVKKYAAKRETIFLDVRKHTFEYFVSHVMGCREFIGIDSSASVLAVIDKRENYPGKKIFVRSRNKAWYRNRGNWYAMKDFSFGESFTLEAINGEQD